MLSDKKILQKYIDTLIHLLNNEEDYNLKNILQKYSNVYSVDAGYDNWNGGQYYYNINIEVPIEIFKQYYTNINEIEQKILNNFSFLIRQNENIHISNVYILPDAKRIINWDKISDLYTKSSLIEDIEEIKSILINVGTGVWLIQNYNNQYKDKYNKIKKALEKIQIENKNMFCDLWNWYSFWKDDSNKLNSYASRRSYINNLFETILNSINDAEEDIQMNVLVDLTGWDKVKKSVELIKKSMFEAQLIEHFQTIGLLCRETIISLAQSVYIEEKHNTENTIKISETDAKRMLDGFISIELSGGSNEDFRRYAKSSLDIANKLTHKRTATYKEAALCSIATFSLINLIGAINGNDCYF